LSLAEYQYIIHAKKILTFKEKFIKMRQNTSRMT